MATPPNIIRVPDPAPGSYNPSRPAGKLLQAQALHMREALIQHLYSLAAVLAIDLHTLKTEADMSAYVKKATAILHTHAAVVRKD